MRVEHPRTVLAGRYVLVEELGRSRVGITWRATDSVLERPVVVKLVRPELAEDPSFRPRFDEAARAVAGLPRTGLPRLLDTGSQDGVPFVVCEHVDGESLRTLLAREGPLDSGRAAAVIASTLDALADAHSAGVLHLDLNGDDVVVSPDGSVRVCDPGLAAAVLGDATGDERTDLRDAGTLLFELLTGRAPSAGETSARAVRKEVPRALDALVVRALSRDGFPTAEAFASALRGATKAPPPTGRRSWFRTWLTVPLLVLVATGAAAGVGLWMGRLEVGGPLGIRIDHGRTSPAPTAAALRIARVSSFDPDGDGVENDGAVGSAADGVPSTVWRSENYFDGRLNKAGVGLLFDLGARRTVTGFRLSTPSPGFHFAVAVGDDPATLPRAVGPTFAATGDLREAIEPAMGRYVLLWFTTVVPTSDGNRVVVSEFRVFGTT